MPARKVQITDKTIKGMQARPQVYRTARRDRRYDRPQPSHPAQQGRAFHFVDDGRFGGVPTRRTIGPG